MSDEEQGSAMEELLARHRKEKKELKEKILTLKKAAKCGNKQKQKDTNSQTEQMEKDLSERHEKELNELKSQQPKDEEKEPAPAPAQQISEEGESYYKELSISSKKQKKQAKKAEQAKRLKDAIAEDRANAENSLRFTEMKALVGVLEGLSLKSVDIAPDGDCLYNALAHQISKTPGFQDATGKDMRRRAAAYILSHRADFIPFLTNDDGEPLDDIQFEEYCDKVEKEAKDGGVWGGAPELNALSQSLERKIEVIQPEGRIVTFGDEYATKPLRIIYQRHAYQLGEHYDSTEPISLGASS